MTADQDPVLPGKAQVDISSIPRRPVSPDWQRDCKRFGAWLSGTSFVAALAWLTGANALVPLSNGKIIHSSYVSWPLVLMLIGIVTGGYVFEGAFHEWLWVPGRKRIEIDHSFRFSLLFVESALSWQFDPMDLNKLGVRVGVKFSNGFNKPIQVYLEYIEVTVNGVEAGSYKGAVRKMRIMPNQTRIFHAPTMPEIPQGFFDARVKYSVLYGPLDGSTIYRHRHEFIIQLTGTETVTAASLRINLGSSEWIDIEPEVDSDMPEGYKYPDS